MMALLSKNTYVSIKPEKPRFKVVNKTTKIDLSICTISDSEILREGIYSVFQDEIDVTNMVLTSKNVFFDKHAKSNFDVVITDIEFVDGIDTSFIKQIKSISPETRIIVYTSPKNRDRRIRAMEYGAEFFIFFDDSFKLLEFIVKRMVTKPISID